MDNKILEKLEKELEFFENLKNPVQVAWHKILSENNINAESFWHEFGAICAAHPWFKDVDNPYHNAVHTAQVMWSGNILASEVGIEDKNKWLPKFILALMFHDINHNGKFNAFPYQLEIIAGETFETYLLEEKHLKTLWIENATSEDGDLKNLIGFVKRLIMGTEVSTDVPKNIKDYEENKNHTLLQTLLVLAQEADVLPSALPRVGKKNGELLAVEWNNPKVASDSGRLGFLNMIKYVSDAAKTLEIPKMIQVQKEVLEKNVESLSKTRMKP